MGEPIAWTLRRAAPGDEDALALIGVATFLESYARLLPGADIVAHCAAKHAAELYRAWLEDPASASWLVESATGAPLAYAVATPPDLPIECAPEDVELRRIYALGLLHGAGAGRALVSAAAEWTRERGGRRLLLGVYDRNERALGFYRRMGFEIIGERAFMVGASTYHDWVLALPIRSSG